MSFLRSGAVLAVSALAAAAQPVMDLTIDQIAIDSATPYKMYAIANRTLFSAEEITRNWTPVHIRPAGQPQPPVRQLALDPANSQILYAVTDIAEGGILKSVDSGRTWVPANRGLPTATGSAIASLQFLPNSPRTGYCLVGRGVYQTTDGAENWTLISTFPSEGSLLAVAPSQPEVMMYVIDNLVRRSTDGGKTWTIGNGGLPLKLTLSSVVTDLKFDPADAEIVYLAAVDIGGGQAGVHRSVNGGVHFTYVRPSLASQITFLPQNSKIVFVTTFEGPCYDVTLTGGSNWIRTCIAGATGALRLAHHTGNPEIMLAGAFNGPHRTTDGNKSWHNLAARVTPTLLQPSQPHVYNLTQGQSGRAVIPVQVAETPRWTVPVSVNAIGGPWLNVTGIGANTGFDAGVEVVAGNLAPGTYNGEIRIASTQTVNPSVTVPVRLNVLASPLPVPSYQIDTFAGSGFTGQIGDGGPAHLASLSNPDSLTLDADGKLLISDSSNQTIRAVDRDGIINRIVGTGQPGFAGDGNQALLAFLRGPRGMAFDSQRRLLLADGGNGRIRRVSLDNIIGTLASGVDNGRGVAVDSAGRVLVAVPGANAICAIDTDGKLSLYVGQPAFGQRVCGSVTPAIDTRLSGPTDVATDNRGNTYIADRENHRVLLITHDRQVRTVAGSGVAGFQGDSDDARASALNRPAAVAADELGNVFIVDGDNQRIRVATSDNRLRTIAGTGVAGFSGDGGPASRAQVRQPTDIIVGAAGTLFFTDTANFRVRRLIPAAATPAPEISAGGVVNAAYPSPRVAPGSLFTIYGSNLGTSATTTRVTVNGVNAPLTFVSAGQVNAQMPFETAAGEAQVVVTVNNAASRAAALSIASAGPGIFQFGTNRAVVQNADGSVNTEENPAAAGDPIVVYLTGQGHLDHPIATGATAPGDPLSRPTLPASARIGDREARILFLGMTPGFIGLAQANLIVPDLPAGDYPVLIAIGGVPSNGPVITIR
jgi:uncharacterized protein (TIGR03437 family)